MNRLHCCLALALAVFAASCANAQNRPQAGVPAEVPVIRVGIIGLDTSHVTAFTKILNDDKAPADVARCRVVAAYPKGSPDIISSTSRVPKYTAQVRKLGVEIVDSIPELVRRVDAVMLETNDGRPHYEQILPVLRAGKPVFIDKPMAGSLEDVIAIFEAARRAKVRLFSASSLRYGRNTLAARAGKFGAVTRCETFSPCKIEKTHPDLFWYGVHGVESLFTVMKTGCESVTRSREDDKIVVTGRWRDGRVGIFREGKGYGGSAETAKGTQKVGSYDGYRPLIVEIVKFFRDEQAGRRGPLPIEEAETIEIFAFMAAADESKRQGGKRVELGPIIEKARAAALRRVAAEFDRP
jgi:predicted dehydrogenase